MHITRLAQIGGLFCASLFLATSASAQYSTSVATSSSAPTTDVIASYKLADFTNAGATDSGLAWRNDSNASSPTERQLGEVFAATSTQNIGAVTLKTRGSNISATMGAAFTLTFYQFNSNGSTDLANGTVLFTASGAFTETAFGSGTYITFDLSSSNLELQAGSTYGFLLSFDEAAAGRSLAINAITVPSGYSLVDRRILKEDGGAISGYNRQSLEFYVQGMSSVPEPANFALLVGLSGLTGVACVRRRRR